MQICSIDQQKAAWFESDFCPLMQIYIQPNTAATRCILACRCDQYDLLNFKPSIRKRKKADLSDFECGMTVGAIRAGLSISETADLLGYSCTTISRVYRE